MINGPDVSYSTADTIGNFFIDFIVLPFVVVFLVVAIVRVLKNSASVLSYWHVLLQELNYSAQDFYNTLKEQLEEENIEGLSFSTENIAMGGLLSRQRNYVRISYGDYQYIVCASPYGKSFFVSYRMSHEVEWGERIVSNIPWIGPFLMKTFYPMTYFRIDTANMFQLLMHEAITSMIDDILKGNELERLSDQQRTPQMENVFAR